MPSLSIIVEIFLSDSSHGIIKGYWAKSCKSIARHSVRGLSCGRTARIRLKAEDVGEKNLYGLYYDYDSSFEHGLWGAIRESSLLKCNNPAHKYHCVPDVEDETRLKTVLPDCIMIMNKTISFLDEIYGIPEQLLNEVINFEIKPIAG